VPASPNVSFAGRANNAGRAPLPPRPSPLAGEMDAISNATVWLEPYSIFEGDGGQTFTWLGDVDGDGLGDLAVGFPASAGGRGAVYVAYGKAGDWKVPSDVEALVGAGAVFYGVEDAGIGQHVAAAGDVDRDGLSDFLIGDPANNRAYLILGRTAHFGRQDLGDMPSVAQAPSYWRPCASMCAARQRWGRPAWPSSCNHLCATATCSTAVSRCAVERATAA
jgi:hypothetical protein